MIRLSVALGAALSVTASSAIAQGSARDETAPLVHVSFAPSLLLMKTIVDGQTKSTWRFDPSYQYRGSLDFQIGDGTSLGVAGGFASVPTNYTRRLPDFNAAFCISECEVTADLWSASVNLHIGDRPGFHQIVEASVGVISFSNFRDVLTNGKIGPATSDTDWILTLGYGVAYSLGRRLQITLLHDVGFSAHSKSGISGTATEMQPQLAIRLGVRAGIGR